MQMENKVLWVRIKPSSVCEVVLFEDMRNVSDIIVKCEIMMSSCSVRNESIKYLKLKRRCDKEQTYIVLMDSVINYRYKRETEYFCKCFLRFKLIIL